MGSTERAIGSVGSSNNAAGNFAYGVSLKNTSGYSITDFRVSYTGEHWRNSAAAVQTIKFYYKISTSPILDLQLTSPTGWTPVTSLDFISPIANGNADILDGNLAANSSVKSLMPLVGVSIPANSYIMLKWDDPDETGSDHGLAIDDVTISWTVSTGTTPSITPNPTSLSGLDYIAGSGPSASRSILVSTANLTGPITASTPDNFEISSDDIAFSSTASLSQTGGTLYVRLKSGLSTTAYTGDILFSFSELATANVSISGEVTPLACNSLEDFSNIPTISSGNYLSRNWT